MMPVTADMGGVAPRLDGRTLDDSDTASDRKFVAALARGLEVLRAFKPSDGYLGNREIAERTRLSKPTVTRLTYTLTRLGYLAHDDQLGKYQLAPGAISIGYAALARLGVRHVARPFMQEMANETGASVALGARDRSSVIYVELCRGRTGLTAALDPGSRLPIATTAIGRALLAVLPEVQREEVLARIAHHCGSGWPKVRAKLEQAIEEVHSQGFTLSLGEWQPEVNGVGVPFVPSDGSGPFAFNCGAATARLKPEELAEDIGPRLVKLARHVEAVLDGAEPRPLPGPCVAPPS
jgi:DNA-binding IclR family transcriptional regulator